MCSFGCRTRSLAHHARDRWFELIRAPYGGSYVKWAAWIGDIKVGMRGGVVAAGGAVRASAGVATVVSLICGDWVPQDLGFVARPLSILERGRRVGGCSWARRGRVCASRERAAGRLVSRNGMWWGWLERAADPLWVLRDGGCVREGVARRHGCRWNRVWMGCDFPAVAGELAGDRDGDDRVGLFAGVFELAPAGVQFAAAVCNGPTADA